MEALILPLISSLLPYVVLGLGALAVFVGIKRSGARKERDKWEEAVRASKRATENALAKAQRKDSEIDTNVGGKIEELKKDHEADPPRDYKPGDRFRF